MKFLPVIGLEIHVQLNTKSKMFCGCSAQSFGREPNSRVCPVCLGLPGALPSPPNKEAIAKATLIGKALNCRLGKEKRFERKHYFYPDLPKGFQISQYKTAIGTQGKFKGVRVTRVHLEEDAGKLIHRAGQTLVDFNRSGIPLLEIVTEPDIKDSGQAREILEELRKLFVHNDISGADMEKGSLRLEANISLKKKKAKKLPDYKVELKNINSFKFLSRALEFELKRQRRILQLGKEVVQETRGYDEKRDETFSQRIKEEAFDYRYFPEPDLPPLKKEVSPKAEGIVVPEDLRKKYLSLGLPQNYAEVFVKEPELAAIFEKMYGQVDPLEAANAIVNKRFGEPKKLGAKKLVGEIRKSKKKVQISQQKVTQLVERVILDNQKAVRDYRAGKEAALQFLLGELMKKTKGKIDPSGAKELLRKSLKH